MKKTILRVLQSLLFLAFGLFLIVFFWNKLSAKEQHEIIINLLKSNVFWVSVAAIVGIASHLLRAARWNLLIETFEPRPGLRNTFWAVMGGYLMNMVVPRLGEVTRCAMLSKKEKIAFDKLIGSVVAERTFDMVFFVILLFTSIGILYSRLHTYVDEKVLIPLKSAFSNPMILVCVILVFLSLIILFFVLLKRYKHIKIISKIYHIANNIKTGCMSVFKLKKAAWFFFYTFLMWFSYFLMVLITFYCLEQTMNLPAQAAFSVLVFGTIGIILVQGGIGIYPLIVSQILALYGLDIALGYTIGWLSWIIQTFIVLFLGVTAFMIFGFNLSKNEKRRTDIA